MEAASNELLIPNFDDHSAAVGSRHVSSSKPPEKVRISKRAADPNRIFSGGRRMVENFGHFLASRNVINRQLRYDKMVSADGAKVGTGQSTANSSTMTHSVAENRSKRPLSRGRKRQLDQREQVKIFEHPRHQSSIQFPHYSEGEIHHAYTLTRFLENYRPESQAKKCKVRRIMGALLSPNQRNKTSLLICLLRSPAFLAALFSLILVATLMVLYTLSFHNNLAQQQLAGPSITEQMFKQHHINSRHLESRIRDEVGLDAFSRALTVQTECGAYVGQPEGRAIVFRGIPYASPPVGRRRWTRPRPIWLDRDLCKPAARNEPPASDWRPHCAQLSPMTHRFTGHEDCLYMDVFSPQLGDQFKKLPVMVYIHGGFLAYGSGAGQTQMQVDWMRARPSAQLASELDVVMVAFNYRLQALGFMALAQLAQNNGPDGSEGNYGLWDQLAALNWIKRNIESFGGNPDNIVLFGPDSASALPLALLSQTLSDEHHGDHDDHHVDIPVAQEGVRSSTVNNKQTSDQMLANNGTNEDERPNYRQPLEGKSSLELSARPRDLFRAAWLTNPTLYYDLPYELANVHYQRLLLSQSSCFPTKKGSNSSGGGGGGDEPAGMNQIYNNSTSESVSSTNNGTQKNLTSESLSISPPNLASKNGPIKIRPFDWPVSEQEVAAKGNQLLECLMSLSAEQVIRQYLGRDDPSYRLDDQNSLPIHGIFADQFVTVDRELVQSSYPLGRKFAGLPVAGPRTPQTQDRGTNIAGLNRADADGISGNPIIAEPQANGRSASAGPAVAGEGTHYGPVLNEISASSSDGANDNCSADSSRCQQTSAKARGARHHYDLLLGSSAQAVEYWPCPRNLEQWQWDDFKRYVGTSLNSFSPETYKRASDMYNVPSRKSMATNDSTLASAQTSPKETYLTMVSDIKQICPINELAESLLTRQHNVRRYIVETVPSSARHLRPASGNFDESQHQQEVEQGQANIRSENSGESDRTAQKFEFAHHMWDLIAFFGFESEPDFKPSEQDLKFQAQIREMVRKFAHQRERAETRGGTQLNINVNIFSKNATLRQVTHGYKRDECGMWRRHLGRSYAWVS